MLFVSPSIAYNKPDNVSYTRSARIGLIFFYFSKMNFNIFAFVFLSLVAVFCSATQVQQCKGAKEISDLSSRVKIGNCKKPPCRLRKNTSIDFQFKFKPDEPVPSIKNSVSATIVGIPLPFVGVDGTDACDYIYAEDGTTKEKCPLTPGKEYVYKNKIDVLQIYPNVKAIVHWGLTSPSGSDVVCMEVPARITN